MEVEREEEYDEEYPVKQVALTVPNTDDTTLPVLTFRMWVLGLGSCILLSFFNQFFWYRTQPIFITSICAQIAVVPLGNLMAKKLPTRNFFQGSSWEFSLNPGPFNVKEHVLITIFANSGAGTVYATYILSSLKLFYKREFTFVPALFVMMTSQLLGFGWAGIFRRYLVEPAEMWWPETLVQVSLFRAMHDKERRPKGGMTRTQFFLVAMACSFAYYIFPGYLFQLLTSISWVCWISPKSVVINQLGSGLNGLGIGSITFDWAAVSASLGSPLASPWFATANVAVGFFLTMYVIVPICYWFNIYNARTFPFSSNSFYQSNGELYKFLKIIDSNFQLDKAKYASMGNVHMSLFDALSYGFEFATLSATISHVFIFNGREVWGQTRRVFDGRNKMDIHTRLMKLYKKVPQSWFLILFVLTLSAILFACEYYNDTLQLKWWGVLLACALSLFFTLPIGIITATTNQQSGLNVITEYVIGYLYPERLVANMCFKVYGTISMRQALTFISDFKLGHYMKIPPRSMFMAQVFGTVVSVMVYLVTAWVMMKHIPDLCANYDGPWQCPIDRVFFNASVIWGLIGPRRIFGDLGEYRRLNWFFLVGAIAPLFVWIAHKTFPNQKWIRLINMPVLLGATSLMPSASAVSYTGWICVGFISGFFIYRYKTNWWKRYNYVLSCGLEAGTAFMTIAIFFAFGFSNIAIEWWGNASEGCPLSDCPTAKGIVVDGCPVF